MRSVENLFEWVSVISNDLKQNYYIKMIRNETGGSSGEEEEEAEEEEEEEEEMSKQKEKTRQKMKV